MRSAMGEAIPSDSRHKLGKRNPPTRAFSNYAPGERFTPDELRTQDWTQTLDGL